MNYEQARQYLDRFPRFEVKPGLARISALVQALGNPHLTYPTIHVAGTNGKGSVVAMLDSVLQHAGFRVGRFTSPELTDFRDRIAVNGNWIEAQTFADIVSDLCPLLDAMDECPSQFEVITVVAFEHLRRERVQFGVIEVGLGGRFDATNIVAPTLGILTNVALDHQALLGDTVEKIAWEKAGIAKPGIPLVLGSVPASVREIVVAECEAVGAHLCEPLPSSIQVRSQDWGGLAMEIQEETRRWSLKLPLLSSQQVDNLALVLEAITQLRATGIAVPEPAVVDGLQSVRWPGRLECIHDAPKVVIDGAHNLKAAQSLSKDVQALVPSTEHRRLLFGAYADKDVKGILEVLSSVFDRIAVCPVASSPRAMSAEELQQHAQAFFPQVSYHPSVCTGVKQLLATMGSDDVLFVAGSLRMAAEAIACLKPRS